MKKFNYIVILIKLFLNNYILQLFYSLDKIKNNILG